MSDHECPSISFIFTKKDIIRTLGKTLNGVWRLEGGDVSLLMSDFDGCITVVLGTYHMQRIVRYRKKGQELSQVN